MNYDVDESEKSFKTNISTILSHNFSRGRTLNHFQPKMIALMLREKIHSNISLSFEESALIVIKPTLFYSCLTWIKNVIFFCYWLSTRKRSTAFTYSIAHISMEIALHVCMSFTECATKFRNVAFFSLNWRSTIFKNTLECWWFKQVFRIICLQPIPILIPYLKKENQRQQLCIRATCQNIIAVRFK